MGKDTKLGCITFSWPTIQLQKCFPANFYCTSSFSPGKGLNVGVKIIIKYVSSNYTFRVCVPNESIVVL